VAYGNILFVISDTGGGHRNAAEAMIEAVRQMDGDRAKCSITDLLRETAVPLVRSAPEIYGFCSTRCVWLHDLFFRSRTNPGALICCQKWYTKSLVTVFGEDCAKNNPIWLWLRTR